MKSRIQTLIKYYMLDAQDDGNRYEKALQKNNYTEDELRQLYNQMGAREMHNVVFWSLLWSKQFSKQFLVEIFGNCEQSVKEEVEETIREHLSQIMEDLDPRSSDFKYAENIIDDFCALENIRNYIVYCNCLDKDLINDYNFYPENLEIAIKNILEQASWIKRIEVKE